MKKSKVSINKLAIAKETIMSLQNTASIKGGFYSVDSCYDTECVDATCENSCNALCGTALPGQTKNIACGAASLLCPPPATGATKC